MKLLFGAVIVLIFLITLVIYFFGNGEVSDMSDVEVSEAMNAVAVAGMDDHWKALVESKTASEEKDNAEALQNYSVESGKAYLVMLYDQETNAEISLNDYPLPMDKKWTVVVSWEGSGRYSWNPIANENLYVLLRE